MVDVAQFSVAEFTSKSNGSDLSEELGSLYYGRMLRSVGVKRYRAEKEEILKVTSALAEQNAIAGVDSATAVGG